MMIELYLVHRVLVEQLTAEKHRLSAAYSDAVGALRQLLADSREMQALLVHTNTYVLISVSDSVASQLLPWFPIQARREGGPAITQKY